MSRGRLVLAVLAVAATTSGEARVRRVGRNALVGISAPTSGGPASAHPFVNVRVHFGKTSNGIAADPETFRAYLGSKEITTLFEDFVENGRAAKRAAVLPPLLKVGPGRVNRLRIMVRTVPVGTRRRRLRDVDRLRFRAEEGPDRPPVAALALLSPGSEVILPNIPVGFDGTASFDPDSDRLTYLWDFGDDKPSTEPRPVHVFDEGSGDRTIRLTVTETDGQLTATDQITMFALPALDPGRTAGVHRVESSRTLELGSVALGAGASTTFTVRNPDPTPTSQLKVRLGADQPDFSLSATALDLGPEQEATVTLTFTPSAAGHQAGNLTLVASASNRPVIHLLAHGFGGGAPDAGPTLAAEPVFSYFFGRGAFAILPSGQRVDIPSAVNLCVRPEGSGGTGDLCVGSNDCDTAGEICTPALSSLVDANDLCSDGQGGLFLLSSEGTYLDPGGNLEKSISVIRLQVDANANRIGAAVLARTNDETMDIACDRRPGADGRVFVSRFEEVDNPACDRDEREVLTSIRRTNGAQVELSAPIDQVTGQEPCNGDFDQVGDMEVTRDGSSVFVSFDRDPGIYRVIGPPPTPLRIVRDVDDTFRFRERQFQVHSDGAILYARPEERGATTFITLYKIFPEQGVNGALSLSQLTPCAKFSVPNNQGATIIGDSIAAGPAAPGAADATVLVSFRGSEGPAPQRGGPLVLSQNLRIQATVAFASPAGNVPCTPLGLINAAALDPLTF